MASFAWRGRNGRGEEVSGITEADADHAVADQLIAGGVSPVEIRPLRSIEQVPAGSEATTRPPWAALLARPVSGEEVLILTRQLHTLQKSGVPLLRSLAGLQASHDKPAMCDLLGDVRASLDQGRELSGALARHPRVFDGFYVAMVRVGEMTGRMPEVLRRLAEHTEFVLDTRARIRQALRYPAMVLGAIAVAMVVINLFVLPVFAQVFAGFKSELPLMTRLLLGSSAFMVRWWPLLVAALVAAVLMLRAWLATPDGRYRWDRLQLRLPLAGPIVRRATLARFARSYALAASSGVPIAQAMTVIAQTVDNRYIGARVEQMRDSIERGESISRCASAAGIFTPMVLQMIAVGEETGEMDTLMVEVADMYEREVDYAVKNLSSAIEPLLLLVIGSLVTVLALGVFLPLWNLGQAAMSH
ncbi:MSHA biogenesis protein MshG [Sphaerotilus hippei]|uniref:MSHA biogenesis protein MshG n=1 Tax=Sphaerotilus hippei TaxID=744406 RepID=A0A318GZI8_9BURK|nr:type II secretion system F family protein [Sphaerotilus hippei]PXW95568.1 MSHA biogenesis protein MshG [Sphaerotilus hippei]